MSFDSLQGDRLREAFASLAEVRGDDCPSKEQLWASAHESLDRSRDEPIILHLAECTACASAWRLARELAQTSARSDAPPLRSASARWIPFAAAAAVLLAAIGIGTWWLPVGEVAAPVFRSQEQEWIRSLLPQDSPLPRGDCILRWTPGDAGTRYDILVTDENLDLVARGWKLEEAEFRIEPGLLQQVEPGGRILWRVVAHGPEGAQITSRTFSTPVE